MPSTGELDWGGTPVTGSRENGVAIKLFGRGFGMGGGADSCCVLVTSIPVFGSAWVGDVVGAGEKETEKGLGATLGFTGVGCGLPIDSNNFLLSLMDLGMVSSAMREGIWELRKRPKD